MKKNWIRLFTFIFLFSFLLQFGEMVAQADTTNPFVYEGETFKVTYIINGEWENNVVNATIEIENTSNETIKNWFLGMSIEGEIDDIWNAVVYKHVKNHYVIKNANHNSSIASGEKVNFGCTIKFQDKVSYPEEFYMPVKTEAVDTKRYEINAEIVSAWETGHKFQISIKNNSKQTIEDWTIEFDLENEISSLWDSTIVEKDSSHYFIKNNGYNATIASDESVSFGLIVEGNQQIYPENIVLNEITSDGIKIAEKLVDSRNFETLDIVTNDYAVTPLHTIDGRISAYLVQYYEEGEPTGYVVVSNEVDCMEYYIEFGFGSPNMIDKMIDLVEAECAENVDRIIYVGNYTYYALVGDTVYTINNLEPRMLTTEEEQELSLVASDPQYYDKYVTLTLSDIYAREVGYASVRSGESPYVPNLTTFKTMTETGNAYLNQRNQTITNHCGPTAALNMLFYWSNRGYTPLPLGGSSWENTFCKLCDDMKTVTNNTTYNFDIEAAFRDLFSAYEGTFIEYIYSISWEVAQNYLDRAAVILSLQDSQIYGNHAVLGIGHYTFFFSSGWSSKYFKIVDGWEDEKRGTGARYVNYSLGIDHIGAIIVEPQR